MIAPLRSRHRLMTATLALLAPLGVAAGLAARPTWPGSVPRPAPEGLVMTPGLGWELGMGWEAGALLLAPPRKARAPRVLVYASNAPTPAALPAALPEDALLLGPLTGGRVTRLEAPAEEAGSLILYSLGHGEVVAWRDLAGGQH